MKLYCLVPVAVACLQLEVAQAADDYNIQAAAQQPPKEVAAGMAELMLPKGFKITKSKQTLCEIWLRRAVPLRADVAPSESVQYPFDSGQLLGIIRFEHKTTDFRNHEIAAGVYTLRYGLQPVDGDHEGTSDTRDSLLLSPAAQDRNPAKLEQDNLYKVSRAASGTTHPTILPMQAVSADVDFESVPSMLRDEPRDLWSVVLKCTTSAAEQADQAEDRLIQFVLVGHAAE